VLDVETRIYSSTYPRSDLLYGNGAAELIYVGSGIFSVNVDENSVTGR